MALDTQRFVDSYLQRLDDEGVFDDFDEDHLDEVKEEVEEELTLLFEEAFEEMRENLKVTVPSGITVVDEHGQTIGHTGESVEADVE